MVYPASTLPSLNSVLENSRNVTASVKAQAGNALVTLQAGPVNTVFIFQMLDQVGNLITYLNQIKSMVGLNAYATANIPGYAGTLTTDITTVVNAAQAIITWIAATFPVGPDGSLQAEKLNADGSRTPASFTSAQTLGLQNAIASFIATIG